MKTKIMLLVLFVGVVYLLGCTSNQTNLFEGNWELVSTEGTYEIGEADQFSINMVKDTENFGMKLIHDGYFMFSNQLLIEGEESACYGYGTYTYDNNVYTEKIIFHCVEDAIGTTESYEMTVDGDTLIQKGPLDNDAGMQFVETYVRK